MNDSLISVIVPIYKVEQYLRKCVDSILAQTYTNLEVILVDDGSPDNCGIICDEYAAKDPRVVVIHKENGGVSAARNSGLDVANGEYIGFVDSDDWIEADMYQGMMDNINRYNCDIAICGAFHSYSNGELGADVVGTPIVMTPDEAVVACFNQQGISVYLGTKVYRRKIFNTIRCPVGMITSEDAYVIVELLSKARAIAVDSTPKYHYRQRMASAVHSKSVKQFEGYGEGFAKISTDIVTYFPHLSEYAREVYLRGLYSVVYFASGIPEAKSHPQYRKGLKVLRHSLAFVLSSKYFSTNEKIKAILLNISVPLFCWAVAIRKRFTEGRKLMKFN